MSLQKGEFSRRRQGKTYIKQIGDGINYNASDLAKYNENRLDGARESRESVQEFQPSNLSNKKEKKTHQQQTFRGTF